MSADIEQIGRLALREEGEVINAYYAMPNTMDGAVLLFTVQRGAAIRPGVKEQVIELGRVIVSAILEEATGKRPTWPNDPQPAPEHERSGRG